jgi:hypothetical protein
MKVKCVYERQPGELVYKHSFSVCHALNLVRHSFRLRLCYVSTPTMKAKHSPAIKLNATRL